MKDAADIEFANRMSAPFAVEDWRVEPVAGFVSREGVVVRLESTVMEVLVLLASRAGDVVSREELETAVGAGTFRNASGAAPSVRTWTPPVCQALS